MCDVAKEFLYLSVILPVSLHLCYNLLMTLPTYYLKPHNGVVLLINF